VAILGAGPIGASIAHRLAERGRLRSIVLIDAAGSVAAGKALDIRQSGPVQRYDTDVDGSTEPLAAASAPTVIVADEAGSGAWDGDRGLALVRQLLRGGSTATFVFACPSQTVLMETCYRELNLPADRIVGTGASAMVAAVAALAGLELGLSSVNLAVVGRPPKLVVGWSAATVSGALASDRIAAHRLLAISASLPRLWPPRPFAVASATAGVVEALRAGSRRLHPAQTILDGTLGARGTAVLLPLELGRGRVLGHVLPSLSPQEKVELEGAVSGRAV
jgi:malate dehydrogenase